jgi:hypothetical protein
MVDCFNELLTQPNSAPTSRNRYFARFIAAAPSISTWSRWRDTSTLAETARTTRMQTRAAIGGVNQAPARHGGPFHRRSTAHRFERARLHSGSRGGYRSRSAPRQAGNGLTGGGSRNMSFASRLRYWVRVSSRRFPIPRSSPTRVSRRRQSAGPVSGDIPMRTLAAFLTPPVAGAGADGSAGETA